MRRYGGVETKETEKAKKRKGKESLPWGWVSVKNLEDRERGFLATAILFIFPLLVL